MNAGAHTTEHVDLLSPFVNSTKDVFRTMLGCECNVSEACTVSDSHAMEMVTAMIGLSGHIVGSLSLSFNSDTAIRILERILGIEATEVDDFVRDAIGEMTNTIGGKGKRDLAQFELTLGLPQVTVGNDYALFSSRWTQHYWLSLESELGNGTVDVGFDLHRTAIR